MADDMLVDNESAAFDLLAKLVEGYKFDEGVEVKFVSWPSFVIRIDGEDFDGSIPTRIMPTLLDLQREVNRFYCEITYGEDNVRRLTKQDKEQLELVVKVDKGSSIFKTVLEEPIVKILQDATTRMTPEQLTAVIIFFGLCVTSTVFWKTWLNKRSKDKDLDHRVEMSGLEKEKMELIQQAAQMFQVPESVQESVGGVRNELLTRLKPKDKLGIPPEESDGAPSDSITINGEQAESLTRSSRENAVEKMVHGEYFLRTADFSRPGGIRVDVESVSDGSTFKADVPLGVLGHEQEEALRDNSWNKTNVSLSLLVKELRGRYTSAKVVSVNAVPKQPNT